MEAADDRIEEEEGEFEGLRTKQKQRKHGDRSSPDWDQFDGK